jgi:AraC-like DNA-binding protein
LVLCVLRLQHLEQITQESHQTTNHSPLQAVLHHIRTHITSAISVSELCRIACMSRSVFYRNFVNELGIAPNQLIIRERLELAKRLLQAEYSVKEAGYAAGFTDINYFVRSFRYHEGLTPGDYKKDLVVLKS